jgi:predicted nucleic acid-binding OB-fold protein
MGLLGVKIEIISGHSCLITHSDIRDFLLKGYQQLACPAYRQAGVRQAASHYEFFLSNFIPKPGASDGVYFPSESL